jgi:hypothetical protein
MRSFKVAASVAVLCGSVAFGAVSAGAEEMAGLGSCTNMAEQVKGALASNPQSANYDDAKKQAGYGRDFCANGLYKNGVEHYDQALKLLGVGQSS